MENTAPPLRLVGVTEARKMLGLSAGFVRRLITDGYLPHVRIGKRIMLDIREIDAFIQRHRVVSDGKRRQ